jgi:endonuclease/exonuclease/phosphatase family metal-dependent hydrolase
LGGTGPHIFALAALILLCGCDGLHAGGRVVSCAQSEAKAPILNPETGEYSISFDVMTYNVEGLPPQFHGDRSEDLTRIKQSFNAMIADGTAPDILVVQEMFTDDAIEKMRAIRYPNFIYGPTRRDVEAPLPVVRIAGLAPEMPNVRMHPSGLAIFSRYPITTHKKRAFGYASCSGADCAANKGMVIAEISIPRIPVPLRVATTHMNAQNASGMPERVHRHAHRQQSEELADFLGDFDGEAPMIIAGDFNMRASPARFAHFNARIPHKTAHHYCHENSKECSATISLTSPTPWLTTQDLQFFKDGVAAKLRPVKLSHWFDAPERGGALSDHAAQRVRWTLSWPIHLQPLAGSCDYKGIPALDRLFGF